MSKKPLAGFTLIELLLATVGFGIIMLSVYAVFSGGVKNWTTMEPQLTMRQETTDALYGKAGDKSGGITGSLRSARLLLDGIDNAGTETAYAKQLNHGTISSSVIYFIKDDKQQVGTNTLPGTFSSTEDEVICYYATATDKGTYSSWSLKKDVYDSESGTITSSKVILKEIGNTERLCPSCNGGSATCSACDGTGKAYNIFTYYNRAGQVIGTSSIVATAKDKDIACIKIDIQRDIDTDHDHIWGEDPIDRKNNDKDSRIDEDKPMDLSLQTKIFPRMLWKDKPQM